jgi:hypothetical protein
VPETERPAELADVGRLARRLLNRAVEAARAQDKPLRHLLLDHLGADAAYLPTASATWRFPARSARHGGRGRRDDHR